MQKCHWLNVLSSFRCVQMSKKWLKPHHQQQHIKAAKTFSISPFIFEYEDKCRIRNWSKWGSYLDSSTPKIFPIPRGAIHPRTLRVNRIAFSPCHRTPNLIWIFYKMSDNTSKSEQQQQMKEIWICADVWLEVFAIVSPFELGQRMALISDRFDALVDEHFKTRKWSLDSMEIRRAIRGNGAQIVKSSGKRLPIPQGPMPGKLIGFEFIWISYVDQTVIEFLQRIRRLFNSAGTNVAIHTFENQSRSWEIIRQQIWPLVNDNICGLFLSYASQLDRLRQFSPAILRNCPNLRSLFSYGRFPVLPAEDNPDASSEQAVTKWMLTPRGDGLPKILHCDYPWGGMEGLKRSFVNASWPVNFIIRLHSYSGTEPFELTNNWTGERLTFRCLNKYKYNWLVVRCPIVREEDKWTNWEKEATEWEGRRQWNRIAIDFEDKRIGGGLVDAKAGPTSEPSE